jgi:hypothetical protein
METNVLAYVVRTGYEIKTWIYAEESESTDIIKDRAISKFKEVGVEVLPSDLIDWEWY